MSHCYYTIMRGGDEAMQTHKQPHNRNYHRLVFCSNTVASLLDCPEKTVVLTQLYSSISFRATFQATSF